eukprot:COSAG01_NODE_1067_length_11878_cov_89.529077_7_plen_108_part_00
MEPRNPTSRLRRRVRKAVRCMHCARSVTPLHIFSPATMTLLNEQRCPRGNVRGAGWGKGNGGEGHKQRPTHFVLHREAHRREQEALPQQSEGQAQPPAQPVRAAHCP